MTGQPHPTSPNSRLLRHPTFDRFRVLLFQQQGGLKPDRLEVGLKMDATFFSALVRGFLAGDIVNLLAWRVRPYEKVPGSADAALEDCKKLVSDALRNRRSALVALHRAGRRMAQVEVDQARPPH